MEIKREFMTNNPCYLNNVNEKDNRYTKFKNEGPKGGMLHSVGCAQPSAEEFIRRWNRSSYGRACVHAFIDANTGEAYQTLPWNFRGWHAGGDANNTHFGIEMCEPDCIEYTKGANFKVLDRERARAQATRAYNSAVQVFAEVFKEYELDPMKDGVLIGHYEGNRRGIASNHADPEHLWNQLGLPFTMDSFRNDVKKAMTADNLYRVQTGAFKNKKYADEYLEKVKNAGFDTYMVEADGYFKTQVGAFRNKEYAEATLERVKAAGFDAFITGGTEEKPDPVPAKKTSKEIAKEIFKGECSDPRWETWGNGNTRIERLEAAGYDAQEVRKEVNKLFF